MSRFGRIGGALAVVTVLVRGVTSCGGGGDGAGAGGGAEDVALVGTGTGRTALPATGLNSLLAFAGAASVVLGSSAMVIGARRRSNTSD